MEKFTFFNYRPSTDYRMASNFNSKLFTPAITRRKSQIVKLASTIKKKLFVTGNSVDLSENPEKDIEDIETECPSVTNPCPEAQYLSLPYIMNKKKAVNKKLSATMRNDVCCEMTGGGLVITLSTAYYEGFKTAVVRFLNKSPYSVTSKVYYTDANEHDIQKTTYTVVHQSEKLYVINCFNNTSRILVNGKHQYIFASRDCYCILDIVNNLKWDGKPIDWKEMNDMT